MTPDARALRILFGTYWSSSGWKMAGQLDWVPQTPAEDLAYATAAGVMFPPRRVGHRDAIAAIADLRDRIAPRAVGADFVATLSHGRPALRSALGSYAVARHLPRHRLAPDALGHCTVCGGRDLREPRDLNVLSFERHKWGGVRHDDPAYIAFDLERYLVEGGATPKAEDRALLAATLATVDDMPLNAKLADLVKALRGLFPGTVAQRRALIGILGFAGVISVPGRPGFFHGFTPLGAREETPWFKDDWPYPVGWWRGGHPVSREAVAFWFGDV